MSWRLGVAPASCSAINFDPQYILAATGFPEKSVSIPMGLFQRVVKKLIDSLVSLRVHGTESLAQFAVEPGSGRAPFAFDGRVRNTQ